MEAIRKIFIAETCQQLNSIADLLSVTPNTMADKELAEKTFLAMHSIKGSAPMFGFPNLSTASVPVEKTFSKIRNGHVTISDDIVEKTNELIKHFLDSLNQNSDDNLPLVLKQSKLDAFFENVSS